MEPQPLLIMLPLKQREILHSFISQLVKANMVKFQETTALLHLLLSSILQPPHFQPALVLLVNNQVPHVLLLNWLKDLSQITKPTISMDIPPRTTST